MAERLLQREAEQRGIAVEVSSAGVFARQNVPAAAGSVAALAAFGLDLSDHLSQPLADLDEQPDLVLTMEAAHIPRAVDGQSGLFRRTFTLPEIVSRSRQVGPRGDLGLEDWIEALNDGRTAQGVLSSEDLDVADPYGGSSIRFESCATQLDRLCSQFAQSMWGSPPVMP
jgi:protein-tyrosine-phosphatase